MDRSSNLHLVLVDAAWPRKGRRRLAFLVVVGSVLIALLAQLEIPLQPVPITGQTFGVLLVGALLGSRLGAVTVLTYLAWGAIGLPVFAGGNSGLARLVGPTGGYLVGFLGAAFLVGRLSERGWDRRVLTTAVAMLLGTILIYLPGIAWLSRFVGWDRVLELGLAPFVIGDLLKVALAALALPIAWTLVGSEQNRMGRRNGSS
jgi:biotin transport system substrate-specific component